MHYYKFNIGDYWAATTHLTPLEHYIYRSLIDRYYLNEKPFESVEQIARLLMLSSSDEINAIQGVLDEFFNLHKGRYYHKRIRQEVKDFHAGNYRWDENSNESNGGNKKSKKSLESNEQGNEKITESNGVDNAQNNDKKALSNSERQTRYKERKRMLKALSDKGISVDDNANFWQVCEIFIANFPKTDNEKSETVTESDNESNEQNNGKNGARTNNHKPITINQYISPQAPQGAGVDMAGTHEATEKTTQKTQSSSDTDKTLNVPFENFWDLYDKKVDPKKCKPLWERLSDKDRLDAMAYIPNYKQAQPNKKYRKNPQTFLNARAWESEIIDSQPQPKSQPTWTPQPTQDIVDVQFGGSYQAFLRHQALQERERFPQPLTPEEIERNRQAGLAVLSQFMGHKPQPAI